MNHYVIFEDEFAEALYPFSLNHASFEVRCGNFTNLDRIRSILQPNDRVTLLVRSEIADLIKERFSGFSVNPGEIDPGLWLNGACLWSQTQIEAFSPVHSYTVSGRLAAFTTRETVTLENEASLLSDASEVSSAVDGILFNHIWDAIFHNGRQIYRDAAELFLKKPAGVHPSATLVNPDDIFLGPGSIVAAGAVLDATKGPIIIGDKGVVGIGALVQGPVSIGQASMINPGAKLMGNVTTGPVCKIGGELEDCILQGFSNKQHDGFLGHSYLGEWINLGANTNTSDLKNNYSSVSVTLDDKPVETGMQFLGTMMGDFSKTGISTMLNTGTVCGMGANIFGSDFQPKFIPSFAWGRSGRTEIDKFIKTCELAKARRGAKLTIAEKEFFRYLYEQKIGV
ncbi:MAG: hypothetical protein GXO91_05625 [FCB group bacterium]|nr:hypothetical protein [FCB group bacterium]